MDPDAALRGLRLSAAAPTARRPLLDLRELPGRPAALSRPVAHVTVAGALVAIMAAAAALRLYHLDAQSLWFDEGLSQWGAQQPPGAMVRWLIHSSVHPPLYFLYLHAWIKLGGDSVAWMRLSSVIPSVLTLPVVYGLARRLHSSSAGLLAAALVAISPFFIYYGQDLRMYALFGLAATSASYCLVWGLQSPRRLPWFLYAIAAAATLYLHNVGIAVVLAHAVIVLTAWLGANPGGRRGALAIAAAVAAWLPWLPVALGQRSGKGASLGWITNPDTQRVADLVRTFTSDMVPPHVRARGAELPLGGLRVWLIAVSLLLVFAGLTTLRRRRGALLVGATLLLGPFVLALDAGVTQPVFLDRTLLPVALTYFVMMAIGCTAIAARRGGPAFVGITIAVLVALNAIGLASFWNLNDKRDVNEPWNKAASLVAAYQRPGDVIVFRTGSATIPFGYYYARTRVKRLPSYGSPCPWLAVCPGVPSWGVIRAWLAARVLPYRRLWVVRRWYGNWDFDLPQAIGLRAAARFRRVGEENFSDGVVVRLYERVGSPTLPRRTANLARFAETPVAKRRAARFVPDFAAGPPRATSVIAVAELIALLVAAAWLTTRRLYERTRPRLEPAAAGGADVGALDDRPPSSSAIDLNTASVEELISLPSVGRKAAERIVAQREREGPYRSVADLQKVDGFHSDRVRRIAPHARV
jgi:mannosyltransferase